MSAVQEKIAAIQGKISDFLGRVPAKKVDMAIALLVTAAGLVVYAYTALGANSRAGFALLNDFEQRTIDARFKARGPRPHDDNIVIVAVDENSLNKVGTYPIPRNGYALAVDKLAQGGAKVVAFDVAFNLPEKNSAVEALQKLQAEIPPNAPPAVVEKIREIERTSDNDAILADSMKKAGNVLLGHFFLDQEAAKTMDQKAAEDYFNVLWGKPFPQIIKTPPNAKFDLSTAWNRAGGYTGYGIFSNIRLLAEAARSYGFFDHSPDADGTIRREPLLIRYRDRDFFPSLALQTVREYENIKDQSIVGYMAEDGLERIELGPHVITTSHDGSVLINYTGPYKTYKHYSIADVIDGTVPPETFKDKIVLLGYTAKAAGDLRSTPFQKADAGYMGVEIHANVIDNMLHDGERGRGFLSRSFNEEMIDIGFILLFGLGMGFLFARLKPLQSTFSVVIALLAFGGLAYLAFAHFGMWLYVVIPSGTLVVNYGAITSFRMVFEEREKRKVRKTFERYVSPGVIRLIEQNPKKYFKTGGESKELTVMFSDIRSFTTIAEGLTPNELVGLLNEYLGEMTDILFKRWGTLDKYIGDAVMAFWGSPFPQEDHAVRACSAALDMSARLEELNLKWEVEKKKPLEIGIGVNTGVVNVGNMGSSRRFAWTVMGDHVNLASRLEGQNKEYHTARIISEFTYGQVKDHFVTRELDKIRVKGKLKPVAIYELMAFNKDAAKYQDLLQRWADAQNAYYRQAWDEAVQKFEDMLGRYPDDGPAHTFLKRSYEYRKEAPARDWDGVYIAKSK